jgi:hypothetical protein
VAKDVRASHGAIIDLFERIESVFKNLEVYTQISLTTKMAEVFVKIVIELLSILSIATKEVKRPLASESSGGSFTLHHSCSLRVICQETIGEDRYRGCIEET